MNLISLYTRKKSDSISKEKNFEEQVKLIQGNIGDRFFTFCFLEFY
ncbi:hypothetical protein [Leptospira noguchii]|nr:hypothetical protein [Leptospira noguchii]MCH1911526.1 hypothetical protein [Leptospira noguchii]MCH1914590.1 hypothetical protein [Leptospira noguchii]UOG64518.1 hypothetical protein MAL04_02730 [Leptospira noguchii]